MLVVVTGTAPPGEPAVAQTTSQPLATVSVTSRLFVAEFPVLVMVIVHVYTWPSTTERVRGSWFRTILDACTVIAVELGVTSSMALPHESS